MAKQSKRSRKFQASGGVAARLKKGTITKRGKLKARPTKVATSKVQSSLAQEPPRARESRQKDDFMGTQNLATLDLDAFFTQVADSLEDPVTNDADCHSDERRMKMPQDAKNKEDDNKKARSNSSSSSSSSDDDTSSGTDSTDDTEMEATTKETKSKKNKNEKSSSSSYDNASSSSDSDSDDHDVEAAEARMRHEMARLQQRDPEFAAFLKENELDLLQFGQDDNEDDHDHDAKDVDIQQDDDEETEKPKSKLSTNETILTMALLDTLRLRTFNTHSTKALKKLVAAYRSGCHLADAADVAHETGSRFYSIESPAVFDSLMVLCLSRCHEAFTWHLVSPKENKSAEEEENIKDDNKNNEMDDADDDDHQPIPPHKLENATQWDSVKPALQSFLKSTIHLLQASKEPGLLAFVLKSLAKYLRFMTPFPRLAEALLKTCITLWSSAAALQQDDGGTNTVRLQAFFRIRQLALTQPFPFAETILKKSYLAYAQHAIYGTSSSLATTLPLLTFMGNGLVELYSLDFQSSYQHAFVYIRQLALQLRAALQKKTPQALKQVYGWQFVHCLKLWVAVLAHAAVQQDEGAPDAQLLASLVYPMAEIIAGTARLAPSPVRLFPLRLQCIRLLQQLAASAQIYLPTTSLLLDCFDWKEWYTKPKKATKSNTLRGLPLHMLLKLPKDDPMRTHEQLEAGVVQLFLLLEREMELYRYTAAFAEFRVRIRQRCRDFSRLVHSSRWRAYAKACIDKSDQYAHFCTVERARLAQAPKDIAQLECLRPSHVASMRERHQKALDLESKTARSSLAAASAAPSLSQAKSSKHEQDCDDSSTENIDQENDQNDEMEQANENGRRTKSEVAKKSKKKRSKKKGQSVSSDRSEQMMDQQDEVFEGADWLEE